MLIPTKDIKVTVHGLNVVYVDTNTTEIFNLNLPYRPFKKELKVLINSFDVRDLKIISTTKTKEIHLIPSEFVSDDTLLERK